MATQQVEKTVDQVLTQRGLDSASHNPDVLVGYHFFVEDKTRTVANKPTRVHVHGSRHGWGRWGYRGWSPSWWDWNTWGPVYSQEKYEAGTVVVDMVDANTKQLIWRGSIQNATVEPARINSQLTREVQRITAHLPKREN